jgi:hypothetical protein
VGRTGRQNIIFYGLDYSGHAVKKTCLCIIAKQCLYLKVAAFPPRR